MVLLTTKLCSSPIWARFPWNVLCSWLSPRDGYEGWNDAGSRTEATFPRAYAQCSHVVGLFGSIVTLMQESCRSAQHSLHM